MTEGFSTFDVIITSKRACTMTSFLVKSASLHSYPGNPRGIMQPKESSHWAGSKGKEDPPHRQENFLVEGEPRTHVKI